MKRKLFFAAVALVALASCTSDDFIGDVTTPQDNSPSASDAIVFSSASQGSTRANKYGADAADLLGNQFIVLGVKGDGTGVNQTTVFPNYVVSWTQNTAGKTQSNTSDWEYVGVTPISNITGVSSQSIKYWDYSAKSYDFAAYSAGKGNAIVTTTPLDNEIKASSISYATSSSSPASYTLTGTRSDLAECYITDMLTVGHADFGKEVVLNFRSLATKVRMALYETVPGYSVANVKFYSADQTRPITTTASSEDATLIGSAFYTGGTYTVSFPHIGSDDADPSATYHSDYNKAHVEMTTITSTDNTQAFGSLNYGSKEKDELPASSTSFLKRTSSDPSFAGNGTYYKTVLPKENGTVLELCVDYTLVPIDGAEETITIYGAKAFVPAVYTKWMPNYAYTYIFKISDNTNGWTNPTGTDATDPAGLFPITFDAVVLDNEETGHQTTITTVATPSITTYQKGHVYSATNEYKTGDIYVQVMREGVLVNDLKDDGKSFFYKLSADKTEAEVMDALNIRTSGDATTVIGRNGLTLTPATINAAVTAIPGEDGNDITVNAGEAAKLSPSDAGTYAYVYDYTPSTPGATPTTIYTAVQLTTDSAPTDFTTKYYKKTGADTYVQCTGTDYVKDGYFYTTYTDRNHTYAVKVIKVQ